MMDKIYLLIYSVLIVIFCVHRGTGELTHWRRSRRKQRDANAQQSNEAKSLFQSINEANLVKEREKRKIVTDLLDAILAVMKYITFALVNFMMGRYFDMIRNLVNMSQIVTQYLTTI